MNIIKKTGSAIAKNREAATVILATHGISPETNKNSDLIKAAFVAIKGGNTGLATDLAGLIELNKLKTPSEKKNALVTIRDRIAIVNEKLKDLGVKTSNVNDNSGNTVISLSDNSLMSMLMSESALAEKAAASSAGEQPSSAPAAAMSADGSVDPIEANAADLTATVQAGDPEVLSSEALNAFIIAPAILLSISFILIIILMIYGVGRFAKA